MTNKVDNFVHEHLLMAAFKYAGQAVYCIDALEFSLSDTITKFYPHFYP